jgi:hypothetical protein
MSRPFALVLLFVALLASVARPADPPADAKVVEAKGRLLAVLLDEAKADERVKAVGDLAAVGSPAAAKALLEALESLAARTTQVETRAARTRKDYEPYKGAAQASDRDWQIKQRLLQQMEKDDAILAGDGRVLDAIAAAVASAKEKESVQVFDRAAQKTESPKVRALLASGLLRNSLADAKAVAKRSMADADASVRLSALLAIGERRDPALVDFVVKALTDTGWAIRQVAVRTLAAIGDARAVGPLVSAMAAEEGTLLEDYAAALTKLTGASLGPNPEAWKRWYDDHKAEAAGKGAPVVPSKLGKGSLTPPVDYYGVQTRSLRLLFLLDCSGSMNEVIGQAGVTTGEQFQGKKIDIAKKMLKAAIAQLHPSTMFDVIVFNTDARQFNEKLVQATPETKHAMNERVDELVGRGGTYTYGALKLAFGITDAAATPSAPPVDTIFLLSDGAPTEATFEEGAEAKPMDPEKILTAVKQWNPYRAVRIHTIAIDPRIEKSGQNFVRMMKALAEENGGTYTAIGER